MQRYRRSKTLWPTPRSTSATPPRPCKPAPCSPASAPSCTRRKNAGWSWKRNARTSRVRDDVRPAPLFPSSWQGLALPSTSLLARDEYCPTKLVDPKAKPWDDGVWSWISVRLERLPQRQRNALTHAAKTPGNDGDGPDPVGRQLRGRQVRAGFILADLLRGAALQPGRGAAGVRGRPAEARDAEAAAAAVHHHGRHAFHPDVPRHGGAGRRHQLDRDPAADAVRRDHGRVLPR